MGYETCFPKGFNASTWFNHHFFLRYTINVDQLMEFYGDRSPTLGLLFQPWTLPWKILVSWRATLYRIRCTREFGSPWISPLKRKSWRNPVWVYIPLFFDCWWLLSFFLCPVTSPLHSPFQTRPHMICLVIYMASPYTPWCYDTPILLLVVDYIPSFQ
jgi:hypothetical protein